MSSTDASTIRGPWRRPKNTSADEKGGIHDDDTAQGLGFEGGTIAGSIHMEQFPPMLVDYFGDAWWSNGGISLYFKAATIDHEPVRCLLEPISEIKARIWMENEAGAVVMEGSASLGDDPDSEVSRRIAANRQATDLRMMADVVIGAPSPQGTVCVSEESIDKRLGVITESMDCYTDATLYGTELCQWQSAFIRFEAWRRTLFLSAGLMLGYLGLSRSSTLVRRLYQGGTTQYTVTLLRSLIARRLKLFGTPRG